MRNEAVERQRSERLMQEALGELPPQAQNFFDYWNDYDANSQEDYNFKVDDWDEGVPAIC
jgi:1,2-phenylacetyl-CoA epoxidase catalytic subunit